MTFKKLLSLLEKHYEAIEEDEGDNGGGIDEFAYDNAGYQKETDLKFINDEIGEMKEVEQHGGEGEGDDWYSVKYFPKHDMYIKVSGFYASYDGTTFDEWEDCCKQVKPVEKTITVYE